MSNKVLIHAREIAVRTQILGGEISNYYALNGGLNRVVVVLKGAAMFAQELLQWLPYDVEVSYITAKSYGDGVRRSAGKVEVYPLPFTKPGENVLVVEDIVDTGHTIKAIMESIDQPGIVTVASMLDKPSRRVVRVYPDWYGFEIPDKFVYGHGLDLDEKHRCQPDVMYVEQ